jgi:ubiquinone/menaquinone biosynthesis C-methylase UbiE
MVQRGWDAIARWRDLRMGEVGDLWHRALVDPTFLRVIGPVRGLRVLDVGCGNGYLTRRWARAGARSAVGVDTSRGSLALARRRERDRPSGARFLRRDSADLEGVPDGSVDLVAANMSLMDIRDAAGTVREAARVLAPDGRFVFSVCHPCFDLDDRSMWVVERQLYKERVWRKVSNYRDEREVEVPWKVSETEMAYTTTFHRTLATYVRYLGDAGLGVVRMEEPLPLPEVVRGSPQGRFLLEVPLHLVVEAVHVPPPRRVRRPRGALREPGSRRSARTSRGVGRRSGSSARRRDTGSAHRGPTTGS